jgi:hypothetical protein
MIFETAVILNSSWTAAFLAVRGPLDIQYLRQRRSQDTTCIVG